MSIEAHIKTGAHALVMSARKRAERCRVHIWRAEGSVQDSAAPSALHGERLEHLQIQNRQHCLGLLRASQFAFETRRLRIFVDEG